MKRRYLLAERLTRKQIPTYSRFRVQATASRLPRRPLELLHDQQTIRSKRHHESHIRIPHPHLGRPTHPQNLQSPRQLHRHDVRLPLPSIPSLLTSNPHSAPGAYAIDSFPSLTFLPSRLLGNWRSAAHHAFTQDSALYLSLWQNLKRTATAGTAPPCFTRTFYESAPAAAGIDDLTAAYTCGGLVEAGAETTATTLNNFVLCMVLFPEAQERAREEIERVVGGRMPVWEDERGLPYVRAVVKEVLRWRPVNKFGMAHASSEEGWYGGYYVPRGAVVVLNWWWVVSFSWLFFHFLLTRDPLGFRVLPLLF